MLIMVPFCRTKWIWKNWKRTKQSLRIWPTLSCSSSWLQAHSRLVCNANNWIGSDRVLSREFKTIQISEPDSCPFRIASLWLFINARRSVLFNNITFNRWNSEFPCLETKPAIFPENCQKGGDVLIIGLAAQQSLCKTVCGNFSSQLHRDGAIMCNLYDLWWSLPSLLADQLLP